MGNGSMKLLFSRYGDSAYVKKDIKSRGAASSKTHAFQSLRISLMSFLSSAAKETILFIRPPP
jgi:hypothetical protein